MGVDRVVWSVLPFVVGESEPGLLLKVTFLLGRPKQQNMERKVALLVPVLPFFLVEPLTEFSPIQIFEIKLGSRYKYAN